MLDGNTNENTFFIISIAQQLDIIYIESFGNDGKKVRHPCKLLINNLLSRIYAQTAANEFKPENLPWTSYLFFYFPVCILQNGDTDANV